MTSSFGQKSSVPIVLSCILLLLILMSQRVISAQTNMVGHSSGGQHLSIQKWHIELVGGIADTKIMLIVTDKQDAPVGVKNGSVRIVNHQNNKSTTALVYIDGSNIISADLSQPLDADAKIELTAEVQEGFVLSARFDVRLSK